MIVVQEFVLCLYSSILYRVGYLIIEEFNLCLLTFGLGSELVIAPDSQVVGCFSQGREKRRTRRIIILVTTRNIAITFHQINPQSELVIGRGLVQLEWRLLRSQKNGICQIERQLIVTVRIQGHVVIVSRPIEQVSIHGLVVHRVTSSIENFKHSKYLEVSGNVFCVLLIRGHIEKAEAKT